MTTPPPNDSSFTETRVRKLHDDAIIVVAHDHCSLPDDFRAMREGGVTVKILKLTADGVVWIKNDAPVLENQAWPSHANPAPTATFSKRRYVKDYSGWFQWFEKSLDRVLQTAGDCNVRIIQTVADIFECKRDGRVGVVIGNEGARILEGKIERVEYFYQRGLREMQLYWPMGNQLFENKHLSGFGREVIGECNRLGILIDLSHILQVSNSAFRESLNASRAPIIVSHDAPKALGGGELPDELIQAVARSGGGHGIFAVHSVTPDYIVHRGNKKELATIEDMVIAIDHVVELVGIEHVAIGADFLQDPACRCVLDITEMRKLTTELAHQGYSDEQMMRILGTNLIDLFRRVWLGPGNGGLTT